MAAARQGRLEAARLHHAQLMQAAADPAFDALMIGPQHALSTTLKIAERLLAGTLASAADDAAAARDALQAAVQLEDAAAYYEPPLWHSPTRQTLGALLLAEGQALEAEAVYREDLRRHPENGWSLFGLEQSLRAQGRAADADATRERLRRAWQHADIDLQGSRV